MTLEPQVIQAALERVKPSIDAIIRDKVADVAKRLDAIVEQNRQLELENKALADENRLLKRVVGKAINPFFDKDRYGATLN